MRTSIENSNNKYDELKGYLNKFENDITDYIEPINLFNGKYVENKYIASGSITDAEGLGYTTPIMLEAGDYLYYLSPSFGGNIAVWIPRTDGLNDFVDIPTTLLENRICHFTLSEKSFVSFNINMSQFTNRFMVVKGSTMSDYPTTYQAYFEPYFLLKDREVINPLVGKSISLNGDSICYGVGFLGGFGKIIAEKNNMAYSNIAVGGATIAYVDDTRHCISRTIDNMQNADYMILEGGVNDASLNVTLGEMTNGFDAELDDTTYCGALESICKKLVTDFHGIKVGFVIVHECSGGFTSLKEGYGFYYNTKRILEKWGIPYIDLNTECPPLAYIPLLAQTYTYNGDGWHPNELGYKTYYVPKIEAWMKTL